MAQKNILRYIILGLLAQERRTGYDIKKLFEGELSDFWYANHSQIYPELKRLEETGYIKSQLDMVGPKLEKKYYQLTEKGWDTLKEWMEGPLGAIMPSRNEFTMKIYLLHSASDPLAKTLFANEIARHKTKEDYLQERWQELFEGKEEEQQKQYGHALILKRAIARERNYLKWLRQEYRKLPTAQKKKKTSTEEEK